MKTRTGKIARLPRVLRDQLNQRLADGEQGPKLLRWLNGLPEVKRVLAEDFHGNPVNEQNLSDWRTGGYQDWLTRLEALEQARELAADADEMKAATASKFGGHHLSDHLATLLTIRCAKALTNWEGEGGEELERQMRALRGMVHGIASLARVGVERQRLEIIREKSQAELVDLFNAWLELPAVREVVSDDHISPEERKRALAEIYGRPYPEEAEGQTSATEGEGGAEGFRSAKTATARAKADKAEKPAEGAGVSGIQLASTFVNDPLKSKSGRRRWLNDPTACDQTGHKRQLTPEEMERELDRIYGLPEGEGESKSTEPVLQAEHPSPSIPLPSEGRGRTTSGAAGTEDTGERPGSISGTNQGESSLIKPSASRAANPTLDESQKEEANRLWRVQHGFEEEKLPDAS